MIDYDETEEDRKHITKKMLSQTSYKFKMEQKNISYISFCVPAFIPLLFAFITLPKDAFYYRFLLENINLLGYSNFVTGDSVYQSIVFFGYIFSISYLIVISPYIYIFHRKHKQTGSISLGKKERTNALWISLACILCFLLPHVVNLVSARDTKLGRLYELALYIWPFFYVQVVMPLYVAVFCIVGFFVQKDNPRDSIYASEYYSSHRDN
jgi:hypothetical protein